jgi:hypothetical protein
MPVYRPSLNLAKQKLLSQTFNQESDGLPTIEDLKQEILFDCYESGFGEPGYDFETHFQKSVDTSYFRHEYTPQSFPILTEDWVKHATEIIGLKNAVELAGGGGWLTHWLRFYGCPIAASIDNHAWNNEASMTIDYQPWVQHGCAVDYVKGHAEVELFILSWPYMCPLAADIWKAMRPGQELLYIGESHGGCTADDTFFNLINGYKVQCEIGKHFVSFHGIHDVPSIFKKKKE